MMVPIDDECADRIVSATLIQSYISLKDDLKKEKAHPGYFHKDDVEIWKKLVPALEEVGKWFTYDFDGEVKKAKKGKK
jgi:hypothetical protein